MKYFKRSAFVLLTLISVGLSAQDTGTATTTSEESRPGEESRNAKRRIVLGIKAGANRSNVYDEQGQDFVAGPKTGFAGGAFLAIPVGGFLGFQPEVLVSQKGFHASGTMLGQGYSITRTTTYVDVPLQLQVKPFRFISFLGGIQYSYLIKQKDEFVYGSNRAEQSQEFANDDIRRNIFGAVGGVDLNIRHLVLSGRAGWDIMANQPNGPSTTPRYKNLWLQGTIGYRFY